MSTVLTDTMRGLAAAGVMLAAVVHLDMYASGFNDIAVIAPLFLIDFAAGIVLGVAVVVWRHWVPTVLAAGFGLVTVAAYWVSVVHGLFGVKEVIDGWPEILASIAEYTAIVCGVGATISLWPRPARHEPSSAPMRSMT